MIKLFEVEGFKNFDNKMSLDFSKVRDYKFNRLCVKNGLIKKALIYGKNSIGKSNFGLAIFDIVSHIAINETPTDLYDYYLNASNKSEKATFHYVFVFDNDIIDYTYSKNSTRSLIYEKILLNDKLLYDYDYITKTGNTSGIKEIAPTLNWSFQQIDCIIKYLITNTVLSDNNPLKKFSNFINNMLWFRTLDSKRYLGPKINKNDYYSFIFEGNLLNEFETLLHSFGVQENLKIIVGGDGRQKLYFDKRNPLPFFNVASNGTKSLYNFFYWTKTSKPSLLFLDDFDVFYHHALSEAIIKMLDELQDTQIILTSHNSHLISNRIMRPDCYFIMTKDYLTSFSDATSRELREGHNLEKLFLSGEFSSDQ